MSGAIPSLPHVFMACLVTSSAKVMSVILPLVSAFLALLSNGATLLLYGTNHPSAYYSLIF